MAAIVAAGIELAYISVGAGRIVYGQRTDYEHVATVTLVWIAVAGTLFVLGLLLMLVTVAMSICRREPRSEPLR